jgi:hypothetical protein
MQRLKFTELSKEAQKFAIKEYLDGWNETHGWEANDIKLSNKEVRECLSVDLIDECLYNEKGELMEVLE